MITTSETYKKKGIEQYRARQYEDAVSSFDQAITLGDRSIFIYDMKITSLSKADMTVLKPGDEGYQARALHAVEAIIKKFEKHQDVWKLHYRKGDILYRKSLFSQSLQTLNSAILATEKLPTGARIASRDIIKKLQKQVSDVMARHRAQALKSKADAAEAISAEASIKARIAAKARANWFATALPPEILVMICKYGLVTDCSFNSRMAGVCPAWRQVITGEKALWQELALGGKYPHKKAALWARYCQGTLREVKFGPNFSTGRLETVSNILEPLVPTIRGLEIHANIGDSILDWRHRFAELTHLMVTCQQYSNKEDHPIPRMCPFQLDYDLCVPGAKSLRTIHLANGRYSFPSRPLPHRGSGMVQSDDPGSEDEGQCYDDSTLVNVTSLKLKNCHFTAGDAKDTFTRGLLNWMRNLEDIDLETVRFADLIPLGPNGSMPRNDRVDNVSLTNLRRYRENGVPRSQVGPLFDELNAPSLRELAISQTYMRSTAQLLHKGFDPSILTSLDISRLILTHSDVVDFLRKTPALRFLNVSLCGLEDPFLKALEHVDAMDDQLLPFLEALSICGSNISGGAVRDFVNSRLTYEKRIPVMRASDETKPKLKSAFGPTSKSKPKVEPLISLAPLSTQTTGKLDMTIFSTQPGTPSNRPSIKWLCLDECTGIDPVYITLLKKHVKYVSCWLGKPNEDRQKGLGRWNWDGDIETCVDIADQSCFMRQYEPGRWTIVHTCKKAIAEPEEEEKAKGWTRSSQLPSSSCEAFR